MESIKLCANTTKRLWMFQTMAKVKSSSGLSKTYSKIFMFSFATEVTFCNFFSKNRQITANRLWCIQTSSGRSSWRYVYKSLKLKDCRISGSSLTTVTWLWKFARLQWMQDSPLSTMENLCGRIITIIYNIIYFIYSIIITNIITCE